MSESKKRAILVVSFGTSYNETRAKTIGAIEREIADAFPECEVRRAFTSKMIIAKLKKRDNEYIDTVQEALEKLSFDGYTDIIIQPTHVMNGMEYEDIVNDVIQYAAGFESLRMGAPLLTTHEDYEKVLDAIKSDLIPCAEETIGGHIGVVLMGHGTEHYANASYSQLQLMFSTRNLSNTFVTTVEGFPTFEDTLKIMDGRGIKKIAVFPFMIVAGDHATNDMAGDEPDSLKSVYSKEGYEVTPILRGLGEFPAFRKLFVDHIANAMKD